MKKYIILTLSIILAAVGIVSLYLSTQSHTPVTQASSDVLTSKQTQLQPKQLTTDITTSDESTQPESTKEELKEAESQLETGSSQIASGSSKTPVVTLPPVQQQPKQTKPKVTEPAEPVDSEDVSGTVLLFLESYDSEGFVYSNPDTGNSQYFYYDQVVSHHIDNINIGSELKVTYNSDGNVVKVNGKKVND